MLDLMSHKCNDIIDKSPLFTSQNLSTSKIFWDCIEYLKLKKGWQIEEFDESPQADISLSRVSEVWESKSTYQFNEYLGVDN